MVLEKINHFSYSYSCATSLQTKDDSPGVQQSKHGDELSNADHQIRKQTAQTTETCTNPSPGSPVRGQSSIELENGKQFDRVPQPQCSSNQGGSSLVAFDPIQLIKQIEQEVSELEALGEALGDDNEDEQYEYLEEMFVRCMIKLDNIGAGGREDIRCSRKVVLSKIEKYLAKLDSRTRKAKNDAHSA